MRRRSFWGAGRAMAALSAITIVGFGICCANEASAQTRRAFVVGEQRYSDRDIRMLLRSDNDANDVAADLEQVGFDKKNITLSTELRGKIDFDSKFGAFLSTVKEGDVVLFFYSGHGIGVEASNTNYLLLRDIKSLQTYTRGQMSEADRRRDDIVALKMPEFQGQYETDEIAKNGVSVSYVMNAIAGRKPKVAIIILDACRSFVDSSGSRLVPPKDLPRGSVVIFSASFGESAIESFSSSDHRRNSLFAAVFRSELQRPGQTLGELGQRVSRMVRAFAFARGHQQEPGYFENLGSNDDFALVDSIGAERFQLTQDSCAIASVNWDEIASRPESWLRESEQSVEWIFCLTAARVLVANQEQR
jgi:hypothetical protein